LIEGVTSEGLSGKEAWDSRAGISLIEAARAHINYFTFRAYADEVANVKNPVIKEI